MIKYLVKRTVKNEMLENSKKIAFYTGIAAVSTVGGYISYKAIKKMRSRKEDEIEYLEYEEYDSDDLENELEKDELKEKVEEFNSRRICHENCEDASPGEIEKHINSIKDGQYVETVRNEVNKLVEDGVRICDEVYKKDELALNK